MRRRRALTCQTFFLFGGPAASNYARNSRIATSPLYALVLCIVDVFTNSSVRCILAICLFHLHPNCPSATQIASTYWRLAVIAAHLEELLSASTFSLVPPRESRIICWHVTCIPLFQPYCCGGGDLTAAA